MDGGSRRWEWGVIDEGKGGEWEGYMKSFFGEPCPFWKVATTFLLSSTKVKDTCQILDICPNVIRSLKVFRSNYGATKADVPTSRFHTNSTNLSSSLTNRPNHQTRPDQTSKSVYVSPQWRMRVIHINHHTGFSSNQDFRISHCQPSANFYYVVRGPWPGRKLTTYYSY